MNKPISDTDRIYPPLRGVKYLRYLSRMHNALKPDWYLEIGSATGSSLARSSSKTIAIDPNFQLREGFQGEKAELHLMQMTSDAFFESGKGKTIASQIDMAFLDGMHLFEFLLRDFIGTEKLCHNNSVIAMHDCIPMTPLASEREWDRSRTRAWTGDVWKLVPILRKYRPDLNIKVIDCPPSGLTVVTNLDPKNTALTDSYDTIIKEYMDETVQSYGADRLFEDLQIISSESSEAKVEHH